MSRVPAINYIIAQSIYFPFFENVLGPNAFLMDYSKVTDLLINLVRYFACKLQNLS